jgi:hypothetical protein
MYTFNDYRSLLFLLLLCLVLRATLLSVALFDALVPLLLPPLHHTRLYQILRGVIRGASSPALGLPRVLLAFLL